MINSNLTHQQKLIWFTEKAYPNTSMENIAATLRLEGQIDFDILERAINIFLEKNDATRFRIKEIDGEPNQYVSDYIYRKLDYFDFSNEEIEVLEKWEQEQSRTPLEINDSDLTYFALVKVNDNDGGFYVKMHHIISDAWTMTLVGDQIVETYTTLKKGLPISEEKKPSYLEYLSTEQNYFNSNRLEKDRDYWRNKAISFPEKIILKDRESKNTEAYRKTFTLPYTLVSTIYKYCSDNKVSAYTFFMSILFIFLQKATGKSEVLVGTTTLNRSSIKEKATTGLFINVGPFGLAVDEGLDFNSFVQAVNKEILTQLRHQKFPYYLILQELRTLQKSTDRPFDIVLNYQNSKFSKDDHEVNYTTKWHFNGRQIESLIININDRESNDTLTIDYDFLVDVFNDQQIELVHDHLLKLIAVAIAKPQKRFVDLYSIPEDEKEELFGNHIETKIKLPITIVSTFTSEPVKPYMKWWGEIFGYEFNIEFAGYNQVFQELLNPHSILSQNKNGVNVALIRLEDYIRNNHETDEIKIKKIEQVFHELKVAIKHSSNNPVPLIFVLFPVSTHLDIAQIIENKINAVNKDLEEFLLTNSHIYVVNLGEAQELYSVPEVFDSVKDIEGHMPFSDEYYAVIGTEIARKICAIKRQQFKVVVLDCDNTLWKGICGEEEVRVEGGYRHLQEFLLRKYNEGMLLAICSKNNEKDVIDVFENNPEMLLQRKHIVNWKVNWDEKSDNIKQIAEELNLGIDSFIFIDDSSLECAKMIEVCPEVLTLQLPEDENHILTFLKHIWAFDRAKVTKEDSLRTSMYAAEKHRKDLQSVETSLESFVKSLEIKVSMRQISEDEIDRAAQLTQRTNQFNLSTIRRTEHEIRLLIEESDTECFVVEASDKFGDYGIVGLLILKVEDELVYIDTLLMSCRILGRNIEHAILSGIKRLSEDNGKHIIIAKYIPSGKNIPIKKFLSTVAIAEKKTDDDAVFFTINTSDINYEVDGLEFYYNERYIISKTDIANESRCLRIDSSFIEKSRLNKKIVSCNYNYTLCNEELLEKNKNNEYVKSLVYFNSKKLTEVLTHTSFNNNIEYEAPINPKEEVLILIWENVLKIKGIGTKHNFFELGGDSLKAVQFIAELDKYNLKADILDIYRYQTIKELSAIIDDVMNEKIDNRMSFSRENKKDLFNNPLSELIFSKELPLLDSVAITSVPSELVISNIGNMLEMLEKELNNEPFLFNIMECESGRIGAIALPLVEMDLYREREKLKSYCSKAILLSEKLGAKVVSLTGLIPSATNYGRDIKNTKSNVNITTGHATTAASVIFSLERMLQESGRSLCKENICSLGLGSVGSSVIELLIKVLPHPLSITLCDIEGKIDYLEELKKTISEYGYKGNIIVVTVKGLQLPDEIYNASLFIGATNVPNILDVNRLKPGTLIIDDSAPHCFPKDYAVDRLFQSGDILFTEGGVLQAPDIIKRRTYLPEFLKNDTTLQYKQYLQSGKEITGCILSSLLSAKYNELKPTIGSVHINDCLMHYNKLKELGYKGANLHCDDFVISSKLIKKFRTMYSNIRDQ